MRFFVRLFVRVHDFVNVKQLKHVFIIFQQVCVNLTYVVQYYYRDMFRCNLHHLQGNVGIFIFKTQSPFGS